jgi:hypothetical protein
MNVEETEGVRIDRAFFGNDSGGYAAQNPDVRLDMIDV